MKHCPFCQAALALTAQGTYEQECPACHKKITFTNLPKNSPDDTVEKPSGVMPEEATSNVLTERAAAALTRAEASDSYIEYSRAMITYEQALFFWGMNVEAQAGIAKACLAYAAVALKKNDLDLAATLLKEGGHTGVPLYGKVNKARHERIARENDAQAQRRNSQITIGLVILASIGVAITMGIYAGNLGNETTRALTRVEKLQASLELAQDTLAAFKEGENRHCQLAIDTVAARKRRWKLIYSEDFSSLAHFNKFWRIQGDKKTKWRLKKGQLVISGGQPQLVLLRDKYLKKLDTRKIRLDFECHQESEFLNDVSCRLGQYHFAYGCNTNLYNKLIRFEDGKKIWQEEPPIPPIQRGKLYRARAECVGNSFRYVINGEDIFYEIEKEVSTDKQIQVGLYGWQANTWYDNLKVYALIPPEQTDALGLGQTFLTRKNFQAAASIFKEIIATTQDPKRKQAATEGLRASQAGK